MASPYQQQALNRKLIYLGLVALLFAGAWLWRYKVVEERARELALLEETRGEVGLTGAALRLGLIGSRGLLTTVLWYTAIDMQRENRWNELELVVRSLTKVQPHFLTPWLFQSWNLAYNVSVESDRPFDKYFWVSRGIQVLADGERQNRFQPELRRELGFYTQHKVCQSDESNVMRSLFQLSCIPPAQRDPNRLRDPRTRAINWEAFERFCKDHPQLVRRLHSPPLPYNPRREYFKFRCRTASDVIDFLEENFAVPSLFAEEADPDQGWKLKENELARFPILPPRRKADEFVPVGDDLTQEDLAQAPPPDWYDAYHVARAWYNYAQEALPPTTYELDPENALPGESARPRNPAQERIPKHMATFIFRSSPAIAQGKIAERLQQEGWFDGDQFLLSEWFRPIDDRFTDGSAPLVGVARDWTAEAWRETYQTWLAYGRRLGVELDESVLADKRRDAEVFKTYLAENNLAPGGLMSDIDESKLTEPQKRQKRALEFMNSYDYVRRQTGYARHLEHARVEQKPQTITARKLLYRAEQLRLVSHSLMEALRVYEDPKALRAWRDIFEKNPEYRGDTDAQERIFLAELKYLRLYRSVHGTGLKRDLALQAYLGQSAAVSPLGADWAVLGLFSRPDLQPDLNITGPVGVDSNGKPFIDESTRNAVLIRRGLKKGEDTPAPTESTPAGTPPTP